MIRNRLSEMRARQKAGGITKAHLARRVGISRSHMTKIEQGRTIPSAELVFKLANYFECPVERLFSYEPDMPSRRDAIARQAAGGIAK